MALPLGGDPLRDRASHGGAGAFAGDGVEGAKVDTASPPPILHPVRVGAGFGPQDRAALHRSFAARGHQQDAIDEVGGLFLGLGGFEAGGQGFVARDDFEVIEADVRRLTCETTDEDGQIAAR